VVVTAEERLERDEDIRLTLPGGRQVEATLTGRDPTTDVAVLRFQAGGLPAVSGEHSPLRAGNIVVAVGNHEGGAVAAFGIVAFAGGPWHSARGGTIDSFVRLDLALSPAAEGGSLVDAAGRIAGMVVHGPRRRALAIPGLTIDRAVDQLLARGQVFRGYVGAGLQAMRHGREGAGTQSDPSRAARGILVVSIDPAGPGARAGLLVGDIITSWNGKPIERVREVMRLLGSDSIGSKVALGLIRAGSAAALELVIGERPVT
jgi:S1-C subfamily serine protease